MQAKVLPNGLIFIDRIDNPPCFVRRARSGQCYWTSAHWYEELKSEIPDFNPMELDGHDVLSAFLDRQASLIKAIGKRKFAYEEILDRVFNIELWDAQKHAAAVMAAAKRFYLADDVGLGKTLSSFAALVILKELGKIDRACVVCTSSVKFQWATEIDKVLRKRESQPYRINVVHGTRQEREAICRREGFLYVFNYESLRADLVRGFPFIQTVRPDAVIFDEAWKIKNWKSKVQRVLKSTFKDVRYRFALNASPIGNGYEELFGIFDVIDPLVFLGWTTFRDRYLVIKEIRSKDGRKRFPKIVAYKKVSELRHKVRSLLMRRTVNDMGWVSPQLTVTPYWVELTKQQQSVYDAIKNDPNLLPFVKTTYVRIVCLYLDGVPVQKSPKFIELVNILTEVIPQDKVLVFSESKQFLQLILPILREKGISVALISGEDRAGVRETKKDEFTEGNVRVLLATSAGEAGLNLQAASVVINLDIPWNSERLRQRVGRLRPHMGGENRHIRVLNILARDTIEERVVNRVQEKVGYFARLFLEEQIDLTGVFDQDSLGGLL